ncbi:Putative odorant receptor 13a [Harpegnathos saltator]|uniref:Putative odorant receptor 13a n=1 Tax=Harpegnathos saltator TaxID=610380 RepID=E2C944_HARSA|nr:Putative odorant receptor 13a [Harpegnathos saltator]
MTLMVEQVASANFSLMAFCKLVVTRYHGETLRTLMTSFKTDWMTSKRNWERNTMLKVARSGRNISFSCYISLICTTIFYISFNLLKLYRNISQSERKLVYQFDYPYDMQKTTYYVITYLVQISAGTYAAMINSTVDTFVSMLLLHVCAQLINLRTALNNLVEKLAEKSICSAKYKEDISATVLRHESLIRNAKAIDNCYSTVLLVHMTAATFQLCFQSFQVYMRITDKNPDSSTVKMAFLMFYVILLLIHLYAYCYSAEKLLTELVYPFDYPYDIQKSPYYVITYFTQMCAGLCAAYTNSTVDTFVSLLLLHVCAQLINLRTMLNNLVEKLAEKSIPSTKFKEGITAIVLRHESLIRNAKMIDNCYSMVLLVHMMVATFQLCFESFEVYTLINLRTALNDLVEKLAEKSIPSAKFKEGITAIVLRHESLIRNAKTIDNCYSTVLLVQMMAATFQLCFESFQVYTSTAIAYGAYECKWYDIPSRDARDLMFIVYRSMIPLKLTAGKFGIFSIEMFGMVPYYVITYFIQICAGICAAFINSTVDTFVSLLLLHVCAQLINLRTTLNNLVEKLAEKSIPSAKYKEGITAIVLRHESLIRYVVEISECDIT